MANSIWKKNSDDDDIYNEEDWDKREVVQRRKARVMAYLPIAVFGVMLLAIVFAAVFFIFTPSSDEVIRTGKGQGSTSFADRATAFKVLTLMEERRVSEAITLAESIADRMIPGIDRDISLQMSKKPEDVRRCFDAYICSWINIAHAAETQTAGGKRKGFPSDSTSETMVMFLSDYADYRARNFMPAPREVSDDLLSRVFLQSAQEKINRLAKRGGSKNVAN